MVRFWVVLGLIVCSAIARGQGVADLVAHIPGNACLALTSSDVSQTCAQFQLTRIGQTLTGPDFVPLIEELRRRQLGGPLNLRPVVGFDWSELQQVTGSGGLFIFPIGENKLGLAWLFGGTPSSGNDGPMAAAQRYFREQGYRIEATKRAGATVSIVNPPATRKEELPRALLTGQGFYGVTNCVEAADAVLNVDGAKSLAADLNWQQSASAGTTAAPLAGDVRFLVRPIQLWELARSANPPNAEEEKKAQETASDEPAHDPLASSRQLGFDRIQALVGQITFPAGGKRDWEISAALSAPRPLDKGLRLLALESGPMPDLPEFIAADITSASSWRWNFSEAMKGFGNLFDEANEPGPDGVGLFEDMLDGLRDDPEGVQVDLRREVFAQLGPGILNITDRKGRPTEELPQGDRTLYVADVRDLPVVADALARFYKGDERVKHERHEGFDLWTVPEGASLFVEGESDSVVSVRALALGQGRMYFGTDEDLLRSTLAGGPPTGCLKDDAAWSGLWEAMRERIGDAGALWSLTRLDDFLAPAYAEATSPTQDDAKESQPQAGPIAGLWRILLFGTASRESQVPLAAAPAFDRLRPSLPPTSTTVSPTQDGWSITISALRREE